MEALFAPVNVCIPGTPEYDTEIQHSWSGTSLRNKPECIIKPMSSKQVSTAVKVITSRGMQFSVRSGGCMPNAADGSILISMSHFDGVQYDEASGTVKLGVGGRMHPTYAALQSHDVTIAGGTHGAPCVGGYILGGGISFFYNSIGFSSDNAVAYEIVLADGSIVTASFGTHQDLFWALKAGSSNYGIVTHVTVRTIPSSRFWAGARAFSGDSYPRAIGAMKDWLVNGARDEKASVTFSSAGKDKLTAVMFYGTDCEHVPEVFNSLMDVPAVVNTVQKTTLEDVTRSSHGLSQDGNRHYFNTFTISLDGSLLEGTFQEYFAAAEEMSSVSGFVPQIAALAFPEPFLAKAAAADNPAAMDPALGACICVLHLSTWNQQEDDDRVLGWTAKTTETLKQMANKTGGLREWIFMNDAGENQDVFGGFQQKNVGKMRKIAGLYDPEGVFQRLCIGGFKLGQDSTQV